MLLSFAPVALPFWKCQPDYLAQNNVLIKRESSWWKIYKVLAARMSKLITARARKNQRTARKDHSISLEENGEFCLLRISMFPRDEQKQILKKRAEIPATTSGHL